MRDQKQLKILTNKYDKLIAELEDLEAERLEIDALRMRNISKASAVKHSLVITLQLRDTWFAGDDVVLKKLELDNPKA